MPSRTHDPARPSGSRITLRFLADHLGLSPASISIVLNGAPAAAAIPRATQERIRAAAARFDYRPNTLAKSLRRQRSFTIGVVLPEISEGYASLVMSGIEDELLQEGYLYFVASHRHRPDLIDEYPRLLLARSIEGLIAVDTPCTQPLPVPVVAVSGHRHTAGVTNIVVNHERSAALALEHLHALGHGRIAFIKGQAFSSDTAVRWRAIRLAARRLGLRLDPSLTAQLEGDSPFPELGYQVTRRLVSNGRAFSALFAFNDISAIGAVRALREAGLRVPEDVSVVGFDDIPSAAYQHPGLTTVRQPLREMGKLAAQIMLKRIESTAAPDYPRVVSVDPELIVRGTTAQRAEDHQRRRK
ncbi:MAG: LacI family transcriptional regulator [Luteitalea sp.]|nr:LacI family transcriptional regulator [Luteitalea sp.]